jgi:hypothetical protein
MESNKPGIGKNQYQLSINRKIGTTYTLPGNIRIKVLSDPEPFTKENKSRWKIVNWYRKLISTYYEHGYTYTVKITDNE